jgi:hypothetical protein
MHGGIRKTQFDDNSEIEGIIQRNRTTYVNGWGRINVYFGTAQCYLYMKMGPFSSAEVFFALNTGNDPVFGASFPTRELAVNHPGVSVTF